MKSVDSLLGFFRGLVRRVIRLAAKILNSLSQGKLSPNSITLIGTVAHFYIAYLIMQRHVVWAAGLLMVFGLFDALDGELARLQNKSSAFGMFLDSATDRIKEIILYCGIGVFLLDNNPSKLLIVLVVSCLGISVLISYLNAWGEAVMSSHVAAEKVSNSAFRTGTLSFDIRMLLIVIGLASGKLQVVLWVILVLGLVTVIQRVLSVKQRLRHV